MPLTEKCFHKFNKVIYGATDMENQQAIPYESFQNYVVIWNFKGKNNIYLVLNVCT